jgi:hypothetical protein
MSGPGPPRPVADAGEAVNQTGGQNVLTHVVCVG